MFITKIAYAFCQGWKSEEKKEKETIKDKEVRENLSEKQIDRMVDQSFPASDPPATY